MMTRRINSQREDSTRPPDGSAGNTQVEYRHDLALDPVAVARVFDRSGIARPTGDLGRIGRMFAAPSLVISAWVDGTLVGVCRALTDHAYCCYLSDLAVDRAHQGKGIGREMVNALRVIVGDGVSIVLVAAPGAASYYPSIGFEVASNAFIVRRMH